MGLHANDYLITPTIDPPNEYSCLNHDFLEWSHNDGKNVSILYRIPSVASAINPALKYLENSQTRNYASSVLRTFLVLRWRSEWRILTDLLLIFSEPMMSINQGPQRAQ